jgi:2-polyprenyl-6-methoxyphenol hydroxylase-like FAD-dependent oxidoreductase
MSKQTEGSLNSPKIQSSRLQDFEEKDANVVIVGAGPIGLLNAIGILSQNPEAKVVLLEKYEEYQRKHVLSTDYKQLEKYVEASNNNPALVNLCDRIKENKFIRTNELEGALLKEAERLGAKRIIKKGGVTNLENLYSEYPESKLIIGADGTKSTISEKAFGKENSQKFPYDYVLQFRYEVDGDAQEVAMSSQVKLMQSYGVTLSEYVGRKGENGKTPITTQFMITKEQFNELIKYCPSKTPIKAFSDEAINVDKLPPILLEQIKGYLGVRLREATPDGQIVNLDGAAISVNEAPATRAKNVWTEQYGRKFVLVGDAALGLSYFKGLNAGIENSAKLLPALVDASKSSPEAKKKLDEYSKWFDKDYAPKKIQEVEDYSAYKIRLPLKIFQFMQKALRSDFFMSPEEAERSTDLYLGYLKDIRNSKLGNAKRGRERFWKVYPHRDTVKQEVLYSTPTASKFTYQFIKNIKDSFTAYKSPYHFVRDLMSPLRSAYQLASGVIKTALAIPKAIVGSAIDLVTRDKQYTRWERIKNRFATATKNLAEGGAQILLGVNLAVTTALMPLRLFTRGIITAVKKDLTGNVGLIENNSGMKKVLQKSQSKDLNIEQLNALAVDIHRKFNKALNNGQATKVDKNKEKELFENCKLNNPDSFKKYLDLFTVNKNVQQNDNSKPKLAQNIENNRPVIPKEEVPAIKPVLVSEDKNKSVEKTPSENIELNFNKDISTKQNESADKLSVDKQIQTLDIDNQDINTRTHHKKLQKLDQTQSQKVKNKEKETVSRNHQNGNAYSKETDKAKRAREFAQKHKSNDVLKKFSKLKEDLGLLLIADTQKGNQNNVPRNNKIDKKKRQRN